MVVCLIVDSMASTNPAATSERLKAIAMAGLFVVAFVVALPWHLANEHHHAVPIEEIGTCAEGSEHQDQESRETHTMAEHDWAALPSQGSKSAVAPLAPTTIPVEASWMLPISEAQLLVLFDLPRLQSSALDCLRVRGPPLA